jgi:hypothetical protein
MTTIKLEIESPVNSRCLYSIALDGCTVAITSNLFPTRTYEFPSRTLAGIFAEEFAIEAIEAVNDNGWRLRVERRLQYLSGTFQPRQHEHTNAGDTSKHPSEA